MSPVLLQVDTDQQRAVLARFLMHDPEQLLCRIVTKVADRRAREIDDVSKRHDARAGQSERSCEVGNDGQYFEAGKLGANLLGSVVQMVPGYVDGHVDGQLLQMLQQRPRLAARAAAEFDQACLRPDESCDLGHVVVHDAELGLGLVVLGQLRDRIEKLRTPLVVEILGRDRLLGLPEPRNDLRQFCC